ncbi:MAG: LysM peptidoglycan-binding domain-containing protein [Desulfobacteraceae bacterium]|nr:LysM peptidoglycan-binding domain-containing protein [Desulfobacteraceae bacterium]
MKWKDSGEKRPDDAEMVEDYYDEERYAPFQRNTLGELVSRIFGSSALPILIVLGAAVVLILLVLFFLPGGQRISGGTDLTEVNARLTQLEDRLARVEEALEDVPRVDSQDRKLEQLKGRFDRLEASLALRMDHLTQQVEALKKTPRAEVAVKPEPRPKPAPKPKPAPAPAKKEATPAQYHTVQAGDTLYSISRKNGLTVEQLRAFNGLRAGEPIRPGQKLLVRPAGG